MSHPRPNPDLPAIHKQNLRMERKDAQTNQRLILQALGDQALMPTEIAALVGIAIVSVRRHIRFMHSRGHVHIRRWMRASNYVPCWAAGQGEDAPRPPRRTDAERMRAYHALIKLDPERHMHLLEYQRAYRTKRRKMRPDKAAWWMRPTKPDTQKEKA